MPRLSEQAAIVPLVAPADLGAGADSDSFRLKDFNHACIIVLLGSITVADFTFKVYSGLTAGAKTTALTFTYRYGSAATGSATADTLGTEATSAALTVANATADNKVLVVEIDAAQLASSHTWITLEIGAEATVLMLGAVAILTQPRYTGATSVTAI